MEKFDINSSNEFQQKSTGEMIVDGKFSDAEKRELKEAFDCECGEITDKTQGQLSLLLHEDVLPNLESSSLPPETKQKIKELAKKHPLKSTNQNDVQNLAEKGPKNSIDLGLKIPDKLNKTLNQGELNLSIKRAVGDIEKYISEEMQLPQDSNISSEEYTKIFSHMGILIQSQLDGIDDVVQEKIEENSHLSLKEMRWIINSAISEYFGEIRRDLIVPIKGFLRYSSKSIREKSLHKDFRKETQRRGETASTGKTQEELKQWEDDYFQSEVDTFDEKFNYMKENLLAGSSMFHISDDYGNLLAGLEYADVKYAANEYQDVNDNLDISLLNEKDREIEAQAMLYFLCGVGVQCIPYVGAVPGLVADATDIFSSQDATMMGLKEAGLVPEEYNIEKFLVDSALAGVGIVLSAVGLQALAKSGKISKALKGIKGLKSSTISNSISLFAEKMGFGDGVSDALKGLMGIETKGNSRKGAETKEYITPSIQGEGGKTTESKKIKSQRQTLREEEERLSQGINADGISIKEQERMYDRIMEIKELLKITFPHEHLRGKTIAEMKDSLSQLTNAGKKIRIQEIRDVVDYSKNIGVKLIEVIEGGLKQSKQDGKALWDYPDLIKDIENIMHSLPKEYDEIMASKVNSFLEQVDLRDSLRGMTSTQIVEHIFGFTPSGTVKVEIGDVSTEFYFPYDSLDYVKAYGRDENIANTTGGFAKGSKKGNVVASRREEQTQIIDHENQHARFAAVTPKKAAHPRTSLTPKEIGKLKDIPDDMLEAEIRNILLPEFKKSLDWVKDEAIAYTIQGPNAAKEILKVGKNALYDYTYPLRQEILQALSSRKSTLTGTEGIVHRYLDEYLRVAGNLIDYAQFNKHSVDMLTITPYSDWWRIADTRIQRGRSDFNISLTPPNSPKKALNNSVPDIHEGYKHTPSKVRESLNMLPNDGEMHVTINVGGREKDIIITKENYAEIFDVHKGSLSSMRIKKVIEKSPVSLYESKKLEGNWLDIHRQDSLKYMEKHALSPDDLEDFGLTTFEQGVIDTTIHFESGDIVSFSGTPNMIMELTKNEKVAKISKGEAPNWVKGYSQYDVKKLSQSKSEVLNSLNKLIPDSVRYDSHSSDLIGTDMYHGTLSNMEDSVKTGPRNVGKGFGGSGLYIALGKDKHIANDYASMAKEAESARLREAEIVSTEKGIETVIKGKLNPEKNLRVGKFTLNREGVLDLENAIIPDTWAEDPRLQELLIREFDVLDIRGARDAGLNLDTNRFLVIHESAGVDSILWD